VGAKKPSKKPIAICATSRPTAYLVIFPQVTTSSP
jgi:hypothetical protein